MIRDARPDDAPDLVRLIKGLAEFEHEPDAVRSTEASLRDVLFCEDPKVSAVVATFDDRIVGMAIYFVSFSTWTGRHGLYLEDIFVEEGFRSSGIGRRLMATLAGRAVALGDSRMEWAVLDWNEAAIGFYRSLGAVAMDEWTTYRLSGPALTRLAAEAPR